jgi:hypothetical protein
LAAAAGSSGASTTAHWFLWGRCRWDSSLTLPKSAMWSWHHLLSISTARVPGAARSPRRSPSRQHSKTATQRGKGGPAALHGGRAAPWSRTCQLTDEVQSHLSPQRDLRAPLERNHQPQQAALLQEATGLQQGRRCRWEEPAGAVAALARKLDLAGAEQRSFPSASPDKLPRARDGAATLSPQHQALSTRPRITPGSTWRLLCSCPQPH